MDVLVLKWDVLLIKKIDVCLWCACVCVCVLVVVVCVHVCECDMTAY